MPRKKTKREVLAEFRSAHGSFYDYSFVDYVNSSTKVKVVCPVHGAFQITPSHHKNGVGCNKCYFDSQKISKEVFIKRSKKYFGNIYDYSLFDKLPKFGEKVTIRCRLHDEDFLQEPRSHMRGHTGCPRCQANKAIGSKESIGKFKTDLELQNEFAHRAKKVHGSKYDYSKFKYAGANVKGVIVCPRHGEFRQAACNHLRGTGCPACSRELRKEGTFKDECQKKGVNYWRALKRREAQLSEDKIFEIDYIRESREINPIKVNGQKYFNIEEAVRALNPSASSTTILRWIRSGLTPEEAFDRVPNPGYADGIVYMITNSISGKRYVGITIQTLMARWENHVEQALSGHIMNKYSLLSAIRRYGPDIFEMEQIDSGTNKIDLEIKEIYWIEKLNTLAPNGYNLLKGGGSGGSCCKPTIIDGIRFDSVKLAAEYVARTRNVSSEAAKYRIRKNRIDVKAPARPGKSLVKTQAYKVWSRIVHVVVNPRSKYYVPGLRLYKPWRNFDCFLKDVGQPPRKGMAFARLNKDKGFSPANCRWMSLSEASAINAAWLKKKGRLVGRRGKKKK